MLVVAGMRSFHRGRCDDLRVIFVCLFQDGKIKGSVVADMTRRYAHGRAHLPLSLLE